MPVSLFLEMALLVLVSSLITGQGDLQPPWPVIKLDTKTRSAISKNKETGIGSQLKKGKGSNIWCIKFTMVLSYTIT